MSQPITSLSPAFAKRVDMLRALIREPTPYKKYLGRSLDSLQADYFNASELMNYLLEAQRLLHIHLLGVQDDEEIFAFYTSNAVRSWYQMKSPPAEPDLMQGLADQVYNMRTGMNDYAFIQTDDGVRKVVEIITERLVLEKHPFDVQFRDGDVRARLFHAAKEEGVRRLAQYHLDVWAPVTRRMAVVPGMVPNADAPPAPENNRLFEELTAPVFEKISKGDIHFTLTRIPTKLDADVDEVPYEDYLTLFFEMCDQPWEQISQAHNHLIKRLNADKDLHFTNSDGTDLRMSIEGMTFASSLTARNVPGSEVFSAPLLESVEGKIVAKGLFVPPGTRGRVIRDITLEFKDGKCIAHDAVEGKDLLTRQLKKDEGSARIGEVGIGTNPHLRRHVSNGLLVEKIGGSFHVALGRAYQMTDYVGQPVKLDNGNRSRIHWDITTMLQGKEGRIEVDGESLMEEGLFLDPALEVLNKGWEAIPVAERPDYWKEYDFAAAYEKQRATKLKTA